MGSMKYSASPLHKWSGALFCALALLILTAGAASAGKPFTFVALGDMPYGKPAKVYAPFKTLIGQVNALKPAFTIHIGDIKSGSTPCSDKMLRDQFDFMNSFENPLVYTPGDNEWTDCHRKKPAASIRSRGSLSCGARSLHTARARSARPR